MTLLKHSGYFSLLLVIIFLLTFLHSTQQARIPPDDDWFSIGQNELKRIKAMQNTVKKAKNVILFLGDGMGISTVTAARIYKGQEAGKLGEEETLAYETFPNTGLSKTYTHSHQVADSAATATAFLCGIKTTNYMLGMTHRQPVQTCDNVDKNKVESIARWAQRADKSTGIVSTARITHATPAASYANIPYRLWEGDLGDNHQDNYDKGCRDIAYQLINGQTGKDFKVILGGGRNAFIPQDMSGSYRKDNMDLIQEWQDLKSNTGRNYEYVANRDDLLAVDTSDTDYLLGLFSDSNMAYELERDGTQPSIAEMTEAAINILSKDDDGFFLLVEGGRIDHAHHESKPKKCLEDAVAFDKAIQKALDMTDQEDTLIVVTADHSHTFTIGGGFPTRGNPILGIVDEYIGDHFIPSDSKTMTTLMYANGPGAPLPGNTRKNQTNIDTSGDDYVFESLVPLGFETHGGEDVGVYAIGPMSHLFRSTFEQNHIAHAMAYAACIGDYASTCDFTDPNSTPSSPQQPCPSNARTLHVISIVMALPLIIAHYFITL